MFPSRERKTFLPSPDTPVAALCNPQFILRTQLPSLSLTSYQPGRSLLPPTIISVDQASERYSTIQLFRFNSSSQEKQQCVKRNEHRTQVCRRNTKARAWGRWEKRHKHLTWLTNPATTLFIPTISARSPDEVGFGGGLLAFTWRLFHDCPNMKGYCCVRFQAIPFLPLSPIQACLFISNVQHHIAR